MSLTHPYGNCEKHNVAHIKTVTPSKTKFYSDDGGICFDKRKPAVVPYPFVEPYKAALSGAAFDYLARFLVAEKAKRYKSAALSNLIAEHVFLYKSSRWIYHEEERSCGYTRYQSHMKILSDLIDEDALMKTDEAVRICVELAKMEQESRAGNMIVPKFELTAEDEEIVCDVKSLAQVFSVAFLPKVKIDSEIVFNPTFGVGSKVVGGADADIFIDGTLYDFKVRKENGWSGALARQLIGYYVIDAIAKDAEDDSNKLCEHQVKRVAFYNARFAEIDFYDVDQIDSGKFELTKAAIRYEYLMRRMRNYNLGSIDIPLNDRELSLCSDDTELEVDVCLEIDKREATEITNAWNKLSGFLKNIDTKSLLRDIIAINSDK